jgi:hypothetical protein
MDFEKQLYLLNTDAIKIDIRLGWEKETLVLDGYDVGKKVQELKGSSSYEYQLMVKTNGLQLLYPLLNIEPGQKQQLVTAIAEQINGNTSYSAFRKYLQANNIPFESHVD